MAKGKNTQKTCVTSEHEVKLIKALEAAVAVKLSTENMHTYMTVYEELYDAAYTFIEKVSLSKYWEKLYSRGIRPEEVASTVAAELFWKKLDYVMNSPDPVNCRGLINNTAMCRAYDCIRSDKRAQNEVSMTQLEEGGEKSADSSMANVHFTDVGWSLVASDINLEEDAIRKEESLAVIEALKRNTNLFEVTAFLSTKLIGVKPAELAEEFANNEEATVHASVLKQACKLLSLDYGYFADANFRYQSAGLKNMAPKALAEKISRSSDRARGKIRKYMGA